MPETDNAGDAASRGYRLPQVLSGSQTCPCTRISLTAVSLKLMAGGAPSIMSPPGGWLSGWLPGRKHRCSPRASPGSPRPERSARRSRHSCASTRAPEPARTSRRPPGSCATASAGAPPSGRSARTSAALADQIDRADADVRPASTSGPGTAPAYPGRPGQRPTDPGSSRWPAGTPRARRSSLILDATTANTAIFAITAHADEREADVREVQQFGRSLPRAPTAGATARPSPPARCESPHGCGPSSAPTGRPSSATSWSASQIPTRARRSPEHAADRVDRVGVELRLNPYQTITDGLLAEVVGPGASDKPR